LINSFNGEKIAESFGKLGIKFIIYFDFLPVKKGNLYLYKLTKMYLNRFCIKFYGNLIMDYTI